MVSLPPSAAPQPEPAPPDLPRERTPVLRRRLLGAAFAALWLLFILFATLVLALRYAILPNIDRYRPDLERLASHLLEQKVTIGAVSSSWQGLRPRLSLTALQVYDSNGSVALSLPEVDATIAWESLVAFDLRLHSLEFGAPDLAIRRDGVEHLFVGGIGVDLSDHSGGAGFTQWLLAQHQIIVRRARVLWRDEVRAAPDLTLDNINVVLTQFGTRHSFAISATPAPQLAAPIDLRGFFDHALLARESDTTRWGGEVYLSLQYVDLAAWHAYLDYPFEVSRGSGALRAWFHFEPRVTRNGRATRLPELTADVRLSDVVARTAPSLPLMSIASVNGRVDLRETGDGDELHLRDFSMQGADGLDLPTTNLLARRSLDDHGAVAGGTITSDHLDLERLADLLRRVPLSKAARTVLDTLRPGGELRHFSLSWHGPPDNPRSYELTSDLAGLSIASIDPNAGGPAGSQIGFANITGHLRATEHDGDLVLSSRAAVLSLPGILDNPQLPLRRLDGEVFWTLAGGDLEVRAPTVSFDNADASGTAQVLFRSGPHSGSSGPGYLELNGHFDRVDGTRVVAYLPSSIKGDIKQYLNYAILAGASDDTSVRVRGALERFPFRENAASAPRPSAMNEVTSSILGTGAREEFHINAKLRNVRFDYAPRYDGAPGSNPRWPVMTLASAELMVDRDRMEVRTSAAKVYDYNLTNVSAVLPDLDDHNQVMQIRGEGMGSLPDLLRFVNTSPVSGWIGHFTDNAAATGNARLSLSLAMPFSHMDDTHVTGSLQMLGNDLTLFTWLPPLMRATGRLEFNENGIALRDVSGELLGGELRLSGTTHDDHVIEINGEGAIAPATWRRLAGWPTLSRIGERLEGSARYTLAVHVPGRSTDETSAAARQPRVVVDSNLAGLAVDLPEPARKSAADSMPLHFEMTAPQGKGREASDELRVRAGTLLSAVFQRRPDDKGEMQVAQVAYGVNEPATLTDAHAYLNLTLKSLDADAWQKAIGNLFSDAPPGTTNAPVNVAVAYLPDVIAARIDALHIWDKQLDNVALAAQRANPAWQVNLTSDQIAGRIAWRQGGVTGAQQNRVTARLSRLIIPPTVAKDVNSLLQFSPSDLPALDISSDSFELTPKKFGKLDLLASNVTSGGHREWRLEKLTLANPDGTLDAQGSWGSESASPGSPVRTRLGFTVNSGNIGGLLDRMGLKGTVEKGTATLKGDINWRGSPLAIDYDTLAGTLHLEASKGQFLKAEPGVAKLLGVLSLQSLARRLTFDYSDIFGSGFYFDSIDADATISDGTATTHNFAMKGPAAIVAIDGSADLSHETQNLRIVFVPRINPGAASIFLLATPPTALATLLFGQVLEGPLSNIFKAEYNVTGPWVAPVFTKVERRGPRNALSPSDQDLPVGPRSDVNPGDRVPSDPG